MKKTGNANVDIFIQMKVKTLKTPVTTRGSGVTGDPVTTRGSGVTGEPVTTRGTGDKRQRHTHTDKRSH